MVKMLVMISNREIMLHILFIKIIQKMSNPAEIKNIMQF